MNNFAGRILCFSPIVLATFVKSDPRPTQLELSKPSQAKLVICDHTIDITYIHLRDECVYLAVIMDVFTRAIRGWQLSRSLDQQLTLVALQRALVQRKPEFHHSDQGLQYAAKAYTDLLNLVGTQISMSEPGEAWQNGYAERLMRTIKEEWIDLSDYQNYAEALSNIPYFLEQVYMYKRIHSALGYLTPVEFEAHWEQFLCQ